MNNKAKYAVILLVLIGAVLVAAKHGGGGVATSGIVTPVMAEPVVAQPVVTGAVIHAAVEPVGSPFDFDEMPRRQGANGTGTNGTQTNGTQTNGTQTNGTGTNGTVGVAALADGEMLRMNFRGVPLEMVLNYLSAAAGFTIILETDLKGKVDVWNNQPVTKEEAVELLNTMLNQNGYAAIRNGRTLTIVSRDEAKKRDIPVRSGSDPSVIRKTDEMVTQVIPISYANAVQLTKDLQPLLPSYANLTANESGNALVLTDTQADVRRIVEIVKALDTSISSVLSIRVFQLVNADPLEMTDLLNQLFADDSKSSNDQTNPYMGFRFGGMGRFFGGGGGGPGGGGFGGGGPGGGGGSSASSGANSDRLKKKGKVTAVADQRTGSVVVSAAMDLMPQISEMIVQLDLSPARKEKVYVYTLENAEVQDVEPILESMFLRNGTSNNRGTTSQNSSPLNNRNLPTQGTTSGLGGSSGLGGGSGPFSR